MLAVDPSSAVSGGALLGDRTRLKTDPDDAHLFIRSLAARDRLGGLSDTAIMAAVLARAVTDVVIVETVGIGQSDADIALIADLIVLCIQPGSGDTLQFMKAGIMELPDLIAVTKADMGAPARRARAEVEGALSLAVHSGVEPDVHLVSARTGAGIDPLIAALDALPDRPDDRADALAHDAILRHCGRLAAERFTRLHAGAGPFTRVYQAVSHLRTLLQDNGKFS